MDDASRTNAASLFRIQNAQQGLWHDWSAGELSSLFLHELCADIQADSQFMSGPMAQQLIASSSPRRPLPNRLIDLFAHPCPPVEMLEMVKQQAKNAKHHPDSPLQKISTVLYYSAILAALLHCQRRITHLDPTALSYGVEWVLGQPWIDWSTRKLFLEARKYLSDRSVVSSP